jgi:zinc transporter ZupT
MIVAVTVENLVVSSSVMNIVKENGGSKGQEALGAGILVVGSLAGLVAGYMMGKKMGPNKQAAIMGCATSVLLWMMTQELLPEAQAATQSWWGPALWLGATAGGIGMDWAMDS